MIKYKEINRLDYFILKDKLGYYCVKDYSKDIFEDDKDTFYYKDGLIHNEFGPAIITPSWRKEYWLNGMRYGIDWVVLSGNCKGAYYIPSDEYWIK